MVKRKLIIHCSDSDIPSHTVEVIRKWHVEERGWSDIGYHYVIEYYGKLKKGRPLHRLGAHTKGFNDAIGMCLCGLSGDFRSDQMKTLENFVIDNAESISSIYQHSDFEKAKPHCAGLTEDQLNYLNSLLK